MLAIGFEEVEQLLGVNDVGQFALGDIAPFVVGAQPVADHQLAGAPLFQGRQDIGPDEAGTAGNENHRTLRQMEPPRL